MSELAVISITVWHSFFLIVYIHSIFALSPHEVIREKFFLACRRVKSCKLFSLWNISKMPSRSECKCSTSALCTLSACLNLRSSCLWRSCWCTNIRIEPYSHRSSFSVRISYHRRIELSILSIEYLVCNACFLRWFFSSDRIYCINIWEFNSFTCNIALLLSNLLCSLEHILPELFCLFEFSNSSSECILSSLIHLSLIALECLLNLVKEVSDRIKELLHNISVVFFDELS